MSKANIIFIPHGGGPLPLLGEPGHAGLVKFLRDLPQTIARPDAIVVISAHWEEAVVTITAGESPPLIFDYTGFPPQTYQYQYPAPGEPRLAKRMQEMFQDAGIDSKLDSDRGFDHGLFVPLLLMYPQADIPCVQISLVDNLDAELHVRIGEALSNLKAENLLILGSGFSFHNMQAIMGKPDSGLDQRNSEFDTWLAQTCSDEGLDEKQRAARLIDWQQAPHARYCHPREEHLLPLQVCYGIGQRAAKTIFQEPVSGFIASAYQW